MVNVEVGNPVFNAYHLFMQTADAVQKYADSTFYRRSGLSVSKFGVLQILAIREGSMTPLGSTSGWRRMTSWLPQTV